MFDKHLPKSRILYRASQKGFQNRIHRPRKPPTPLGPPRAALALALPLNIFSKKRPKINLNFVRGNWAPLANVSKGSVLEVLVTLPEPLTNFGINFYHNV